MAAQLCVNLHDKRVKNCWLAFVLRPTSLVALWSAFSLHTPAVEAEESHDRLLTGKAAMGDWTSDAPGVRRKITVQDLPAPSSNVLAINPPHVVGHPADARLQVLPGFKIELYASGFRDPRFLLTAPNGDIFVSESRRNQIKVLRDTKEAASRMSLRYLRNAI